MGTFISPKGTVYDTGWAALSAAPGGENDWMKSSVDTGLPLSQTYDGLTKGFISSANAKKILGGIATKSSYV